MNDIEQRAKTAPLRSNVQPLSINAAHILGYIQGATEQREIDHENAVRTYCRFCSHQCENYPHGDCQVLIEYRKALE